MTTTANPAACSRDGGPAYTLNGSTSFVSTPRAYANPTTFSEEVWFRTTVAGGLLIGFGSNQVATSGQHDRQIYVNTSGQLVFGSYNGTTQVITSPKAVTDGAWHHVVSTMSPTNGMRLYLDGTLVASNTAFKAPENYTGYFRIGYDTISGWPGAPSREYFTGSMRYAASTRRSCPRRRSRTTTPPVADPPARRTGGAWRGRRAPPVRPWAGGGNPHPIVRSPPSSGARVRPYCEAVQKAIALWSSAVDLLLDAFLGLVWTVLLVTFLATSIGSIPAAGVGVLLLVATTLTARWAAELERRRAAALRDVEIPRPIRRTTRTTGLWRPVVQAFVDLADPVTWRALAHHLVSTVLGGGSSRS